MSFFVILKKNLNLEEDPKDNPTKFWSDSLYFELRFSFWELYNSNWM